MGSDKTILESMKEDSEPIFGAPTPMGSGMIDHSMLEMSETNKLIVSTTQSVCVNVLRRLHQIRLIRDNIDMETGKHQSWVTEKDPFTGEDRKVKIWIDNNEVVDDGVNRVLTNQLTCGGYSRLQHLGQVASMSPLANAQTEQESGVQTFLRRLGFNK